MDEPVALIKELMSTHRVENAEGGEQVGVGFVGELARRAGAALVEVEEDELRSGTVSRVEFDGAGIRFVAG